MAMVGGTIGLGLAVAVKQYMDFDQAMSGVRANLQGTPAQMQAVTAAVRQAGAASVFSAVEAANAAEELAKAGLSTSDIIGGALTGSLNLAAAGGIGLAQAAEISATAMTQFHLSGKDVSHIADVMASGALASTASVESLSQAMAQGGGMASSMGISLEQTVGALSLFDQNALKGSDAGTSLKTMLMSLTPTSEAAATAMDEIGLKAFDAQGNFVGLNSVADQLKNGLKGMGDEQRIAALKTIFGNDAYRAANILYQQGAAGLQKYVDTVSRAGVAQQVAAAKLNNAHGDLEKLKGSIQDVLIGAGEGANGPLRGLLQSVNSLVEGFGKIPPSVQSGIFQVAAFGSAGLLAAAGVIKLVNIVRQVRSGVIEMAGGVRDGAQAFRTWATAGNANLSTLQGLRQRATATGTAFGAMGTKAKVGGALAVAAILAVGVAAATSGSDVENFGRRTSQLGVDIQGTASKGRDLNAMFADLQLAGARDKSMSLAEAMGVLADQSGTASSKIDSFVAGTLRFTQLAHGGTELEAVQGRLKGIGDELGRMVSEGNATGAAVAFNDLATAAEKAGFGWDESTPKAERHKATVDALMKIMPGYSDAVNQNATASKKSAAASEEDAKAKADAKQKIDDLINAYKNLNSTLLQQEASQDGANASVDAANKAIQENGRRINENSEAGRNLRGAVRDIASSYGEWASATFAATGRQSEANAILAEGKRKYIEASVAAGKNREVVTALADKLFVLKDASGAPIDIKATSTSVEAAKYAVDDLGNAVVKLDGSKLSIPAETPNAPYVLQTLQALGLTAKQLSSDGTKVTIPTEALKAPETRKAIEGIDRAVKDSKGNVTIPTSALNAEATRAALKQIDNIAVTADGRVVTIPASTPNAPAVKKLIEGLTGAAVTANSKSINIRSSSPLTPSVTRQINGLAGAAVSADAKSITIDSRAITADALAKIRALLAAAQDKTNTITTIMRTVYTSQGNAQRAQSMDRNARGGIYSGGVRQFARGGIEDHEPQIAVPTAGRVRVWAEPETKGEAYIPFANDSRRPRAKQITEHVARRFGGSVTWHANGSADDWTPDMSGIMQYASSLKVDSGSVSEQRKRLQEQESKLRKATRDLKAARAALSRASSKNRVAAENRVADAIERQAKATRDVATSRSTLTRLTSQSKMDTTSRFLTAGKQQNKVSAKFVKDVERIGARGFGRLAQSLLEDGSDEARAIASKLASGSLSQLGRAQGQLVTSDAIAGRKANAAARLDILNDPLVREQQGNLAMWQRRLDAANRNLADARKHMNGTSGAARKRAEEEVTVALQRQARAARDVANSRERLNALAPKSLTIASTFVRDRTSNNTVTQRFLDDVDKIRKAGFGPLAADLLNAGDEGSAAKARSLVQGGLAQMRAANKAVQQSSALDARRKSIVDELSAASLSPSERSAANQQLIALRGANAAMAYAGGPQKVKLDVDYGRLAREITAAQPTPVRAGDTVLQMDGREVARATSPHIMENASTRASYGSVVPNFR